MSRKQKAKSGGKSTASKVVVVLASASQAADIERASKKRSKPSRARKARQKQSVDIASPDCYGEAPMGSQVCRGKRHPSDQFYLPSRIDELY